MGNRPESDRRTYPGHTYRLGDDPQREGLADTPARVARMYAEMFEGMNYTNDEIADMFCKTFEEESEFCESDQDMVVVRDIEIFSHCEHHLALMYDMSVTVAYVPAGESSASAKSQESRIWFPGAFSSKNESELTSPISYKK